MQGSPSLFSLEGEVTPPLLEILYTASTWGQTAPCPTCRTAYGGLDRRAALFRERKAGKTPVLIIAGPDEFATDAPEFQRVKTPKAEKNSPDPLLAKQALAAHILLPVDAGFLSSTAASWMQTHAGATPPNFHKVTKTPVSRLIPTAVGNIGIVFFPYGSGENGSPSSTQVQNVLTAGTQMREKTVLLIGVSPWGYEAEKEFLRAGANIFHCLLGGGPGIPFAQGISAAHPSILWSRPDTMGRSVTEIRLFELPLQKVPDKGPNGWKG